MRIESEVKLDNGRKILVYASLNKDEGSDKCEVEFDSILPLDNNDEVTSEEIDVVVGIMASMRPPLTNLKRLRLDCTLGLSIQGKLLTGF